MTRPTPIPDRFWPKVNKNGPVPSNNPELGPCWLWTAGLTSGYGQFSLGTRRPVGAHRIAYELIVGPVPPGLELDHLCCNKPCVNPSHLEAVTHAENMRRWRDTPTCVNGHGWNDENTGTDVRGTRYCKPCKRASQRRTYRKQAAA